MPLKKQPKVNKFVKNHDRFTLKKGLHKRISAYAKGAQRPDKSKLFKDASMAESKKIQNEEQNKIAGSDGIMISSDNFAHTMYDKFNFAAINQRQKGCKTQT